MDSEIKTFTPIDLKLDDEKGTFSAVFATMNVVDKDGDLTLQGAFGKQNVPIGAYAHSSWYGGDIPVGKGSIHEEGDLAIVEGRFFLETDSGKNTYLMVKGMEELQQWSYALPEIDYEIREENGQRIRVLKRIVVAEVSPCLMGSGVDTRTLSIKSEKNKKGLKLLDHLGDVIEEVKDVTERLQAVKKMRKEKGRKISSATLEQMDVLVDVLFVATEELKRLQEVKPDEPGLQQEFLNFQKILSQRGECNEH